MLYLLSHVSKEADILLLANKQEVSLLCAGRTKVPGCCADLTILRSAVKSFYVVHRYLISQHPEVEAKMLAELEELQLLASPQQPRPRPLEYTDLNKLTYLSCCIKVRSLLPAIIMIIIIIICTVSQPERARCPLQLLHYFHVPILLS